MTSSSPESRPKEPILWCKIVFASRLYYGSLEGLSDFLTFLLPKLWPNFRKLITEISLIPQGILTKFGTFGHNFGTRNARKSIKPSKDSHYSLEFKQTLSH